MDSGYLVTDSTTGTQATMANSGSAINLKSAEIIFHGGGNIDSAPVINAATTGASNTVLNFGSISNAKITVQGVIARDNTTDMDLLDDINDLRKTLGIKLLYYTSSSDGYRDITDSIGSTDTVHNGSGKLLSAGLPHFHVRVTNVTTRQVATSKLLRYTIEMMETG